MSKIKVGKLVRYTGDFCRWTGNHFPPVNGIVLSIDDRAARSSLWTARIVWCHDTDHAETVRIKSLELDPACKAASYPDLLREFADRGIE